MGGGEKKFNQTRQENPSKKRSLSEIKEKRGEGKKNKPIPLKKKGKTRT